jgi:hypothetical protein
MCVNRIIAAKEKKKKKHSEITYLGYTFTENNLSKKPANIKDRKKY